jgi:hypothetical protein
MQWMSNLSFYSMLQLHKEWVADHVHHLSLHLFPIYKFYAVWQSALFISKGCTIVLPSHIWSLWMVNSTRFSYSQILVFRCYVHKAKVCSDVLVSVKAATEMQVPLLLLLLNRRFFSASKTQWIDPVFHPLLPFGATNWLSGTFSILSFFFLKFRNLSWI